MLYVDSFMIQLDLCLLAKCANGVWKACSINLWLSFIRNGRSSSPLRFILYKSFQFIMFRFIEITFWFHDGTTCLEHFKRLVRLFSHIHPSQQLPLCLQYRSNAIACAAIYLAAMTLEIPLPAVEWWELFDSSAEEIQEITQQIIHLYQRARIDWMPDLTVPAISFNFTNYEEITVASPAQVVLHQP